MFVARTQEEILSEMIAQSTLPSSKIEGTFEYDVLASNAIEFQKVEEEMAEMHQSAFGMTAWDEYLDYKAEGHGVVRREAVKAIGTVTVTGNGTVEAETITVIPIGIAGIQSVTNAEATHDGYDREDDETYRARADQQNNDKQ